MKEYLKQIDWFKWIILALGVWLIIYPRPYKLLVALLVITPLVTLVIHGIIGKRPGLSTLFIDLLNSKSNFSPVTHLCFAFVPLGFRIFMDYDPESILHLLGVGFLAALTVTLLVFATHHVSTNEDSLFNLTILVILLLFYSPTATFAINCVYDNVSTVHPVKVLEKYRPTSKVDADNYLKVSSWLNPSEPVSIEVSDDTYRNIEAGTTVNVQVGKGLFGVGWYRVEL